MLCQMIWPDKTWTIINKVKQAICDKPTINSSGKDFWPFDTLNYNDHVQVSCQGQPNSNPIQPIDTPSASLYIYQFGVIYIFHNPPFNSPTTNIVLTLQIMRVYSKPRALIYISPSVKYGADRLLYAFIFVLLFTHFFQLFNCHLKAINMFE